MTQRYALNIDVDHVTPFQNGLTPAQAAILMYCELRARTGHGPPDMDDILNDTRLSERTVAEAVRLLKRLHLISPKIGEAA